ncbi:hypothetical protein SM124_19605 [Bacillus sp. 31A1R]|uniref:Uncharacterized protein n=1 Tax=Robertmurraya mangrovi TaxID=3098077 RepID=A0ABU5J3D1_9BACI|nr:hypothetical protein [Bacillus sp. 31A1R]MDZ5473930.1 hypothetical protein [Bacillus sp. 31A1R]
MMNNKKETSFPNVSLGGKVTKYKGEGNSGAQRHNQKNPKESLDQKMDS